MGLSAFTRRYYKWCKRHSYNFQPQKPAEIFYTSKDLIAIFPKNDMSKIMIKQAIEQLNTVSSAVEHLRTEINRIASKLPEYPIVMEMCGIGTSLGPQLMAEIGDILCFTRRQHLTAFSGVDPGANQSGKYEAQSARTSKRGSPYLRKTLFQIMDCLIKTTPLDDPVYSFMDKKRSEGKPYYVYMTAGANKFLRFYYGKVREYLYSLSATE